MYRVGETEHGRGLVATRVLLPGTELMRVPVDKCIVGSSCRDLTFKLTPEYVKRLPENYSHFPVFWETVNPRFAPLVKARRAHLLKECPDWDNYAPLRCFVGSRNFAKGEEKALVPEAELLNHSDRPNVHWCWEGDEFVMRVIARVARGDELLDSYGKKQGYYEMLYYGFVSNPMTMVDGQVVTLESHPFKDLNAFHGKLRALRDDILRAPDPLSESELKVVRFWLSRTRRAVRASRRRTGVRSKGRRARG